ncbi:MAG: hypothetical protein ACPL7D_05860 [Candidatus Sumerlaeaceae bacterium]
MILLSLSYANVFSQASLPFYEGFAYATGNLVGQSNGTAIWTRTGSQSVSPVQVSTGSLSYAGLPGATGGKVSLGNGSNYEDVGLDLTPQVSGSVYASFVVNVVNPGTTTGDAFLHFSSAGTSATDFHAIVYAKRGSSASKVIFGVRNAATDSTVYDSVEYNVGTPLLLVVGYTFNPATNDDVAALWINPALKQETPPPATLQATTNSELSYVGRIGLRQGQSSTGLSLQLDELRLSTSWSEVTLPIVLAAWTVE